MKKKFFERINLSYKPSKPGRAIFLNGTSSSGKTSIAKSLQEILNESYLHISLDNVLMWLPEKIVGEKHIEENLLIVEAPKLVYAFNRILPIFLEAGNNIIVDYVLQEKLWIKNCSQILAKYNVVFVGVHCSLDVLLRREKERKDRASGLVNYQYSRVHKHAIYDFEVDTSKLKAKENAIAIKQFIEPGKSFLGMKKTNRKFIKNTG